MNLILSYFKTFNKMIFSEKIPFIYSIVFPTCLFLLNNYSQLMYRSWTTSELLTETANYVGYIIVSVAINGVGVQLVNFRESGFLKTYTMISGGNKKYGIIGLLLSELLFGYISVLIFGLIIGILFSKNIIQILVLYTISYLLCSIPAFLLAIVLGTLAIRVNTLVTILNISFFIMIWISIMRNDSGNLISEIIFGLNPVDYVSQVLIVLNQTMNNIDTINLYQLFSVLIVLIIFVTVGLISIPKVKLNSVNMRN